MLKRNTRFRDRQARQLAQACNRPKKVNALDPAERDKPCIDHHFAWTGRMPCTGDLKCTMCGTYKSEVK